MAEPKTLDNVQSTTLLDNRKSELISYITSQKDAFFKSQQRDEGDLSNEEKTNIVGRLLDTDQSLFLFRYGKYLNESYLNFILKDLSDPKNDDIAMQIKRLKEKDRAKKSRVKNRRYNALQKMLREGSSYFSNSEMQSRDPYLFEQMIGQYMDENQRKELQNSSYFQNYGNSNFSSFMFEQIRTFQLKCRYNKQEEEEEEEDENEEDKNEEVVDEEVDGDEQNTDKAKISNEKRQQLENEFLLQMKENFLSGKDKDYFDYNSVDDNEDYDMSKVSEQDAQDKYFEESD